MIILSRDFRSCLEFTLEATRLNSHAVSLCSSTLNLFISVTFPVVFDIYIYIYMYMSIVRSINVQKKIIVMDLVIQMTNDWKFQSFLQDVSWKYRTSNYLSWSGLPVVLQVSSDKISNVHDSVADHESILHHSYDLYAEDEPGNVFLTDWECAAKVSS